MLDTNSKIKEIRKKQGLSLRDLAAQCGFSKGYLSKIERSKDAPRIAVLQSLANAFKIPITDFFKADSNKQPRHNLDMVRKKDWDLHQVLSDSAGYFYEPLVNASDNKFMTPFLLRVRKGKTTVFAHDSEEFIFVVLGPIKFHYENKIYEMETGDSLYFDSRLEHVFENDMDEEAELLFIKFDYRRF